MDVKTLCLGGLALKPASGYDLRKLFEDGVFAHFQEAAFGSIYPALKALLADGLIEQCEGEPDQRPERRVYRLTRSGREAFYAALLKPPGPDKFRSDAAFSLFFGHLLPPGHVEALIEKRLAEVKAVVAGMETCEGQPMDAGFAFVLGWGLAVHRAEIAFFEQHRRELVEAARQHTPDSLS